MPKKFSIAKRIKSFHYAFRGAALMLKSQHNAWIHAVATLMVLFFGFYFDLAPAQWCMLVLAIMLAVLFGTLPVRYVAQAQEPPCCLVNSTGDDGDTSGPGCDTGNVTPEGEPECTLRAAIERAVRKAAKPG